jgi:Bifunctional DNA primase/polymerase, N-terminal/Primase C terminal 1 (PriCT-1)
MTFATIQAEYAQRGVVTYPLSASKAPAVKGYDRVGMNGSAQLAMRFAAATAAGFVAGRRNRITVVDIDSTEDRLVVEIQKQFGATPLQVITPSGGRHLYYRHAGELRRIRPLPDVDILGAGNVVAAGSVLPRGRYQLERGSLEDLERLPRLAATTAPPQRARERVPLGKRDDTLFRRLLRRAPHCDDFEALLDVARTINMECLPPMTDDEVVHVTRSAWGYEISGKNWIGRHARASTDREEILAFSRDPAAALLLSLLRVSHPAIGDRFAVDQRKTAILLQWDRDRVRDKIKTLIALNRLRLAHRGRTKGDPHHYELVR